MASRDLTYTVGVDASDAVSGLRKLESAVKSTMRDVEGTLDDSATAGDRFSASIDELSGRMREDFASAAIAAERLQQALRDAGSSMEVGDALSSLQRMGVSFDEVTQDADKFATSLKQLEDVRATGVTDLDSIAPGLASKLDNVSKSADSSKSALANMIGNSSQSMGQMVGITGDLGVGIGQIGEYFADAALEGEALSSVMASFGAVVGPMVALGLAVQVVSSQMSKMSKAQEATRTFHTDQIDAFTDALREGGDAADNYAKHLKDAGQVLADTGQAAGPAWAKLIPGVGDLAGALGMLGKYGDVIEDITRKLDAAGLTADQWAQIVTSAEPAKALDTLRSALDRTNLSDNERSDLLVAARSAQDDYTKAQANAAVMTDVYGVASDKAAKSAEDLAREQEQAVQAAKDHAVALAQANDGLVEMSSTFAEMGRRGDALSAIFDLSDAALESASKVRDITTAIGDLKDAAKGVKLSDAIDTSDVHFDKFLDAMDQLRPQVQAKIVEAFQTGGPEAAQETADTYVAQIVAALGGKLSPDKVKELLGIGGDLSVTLKAALDQSTAAKVRSELAILTGLSGETPLTASIALALDAGKLTPQAAQALVQAQLGQAGVTVPLDPVTDPAALTEAGAFMSSYVAGLHPDLAVGADTSGVTDAAQGAADDVSKTPATMPLDADTKPAEKAKDGFVNATEATKPNVTVDADTAKAIATMLYLKVLSVALAPVVTVSANIVPALVSLAAVAAQRPQVPVTAYLHDYPSAQDIANRIGVIRVPVDAYLRTTPRINGDLGG